MSKKHKLDGTEPFIETIKSMIEDKDMWGWLMVFVGAPFLFFGMILQGENWFVSLNALGYKIQRKDALVSSGLSIFMKYVPGKVMVIVGRASFISNKYKIKLVKTSSASFLDQILTLIKDKIFF